VSSTSKHVGKRPENGGGWVVPVRLTRGYCLGPAPLSRLRAEGGLRLELRFVRSTAVTAETCGSWLKGGGRTRGGKLELRASPRAGGRTRLNLLQS